MVTQAKLQIEDPAEESSPVTMTAAELKPILEALIYVAEEPIAESTLVTLLGKEHQEAIHESLRLLLEQYQSADRGLDIKEVAGGYRMATKAEHHEWVRKYVKHHTPPTKLSLASLETLAVIAYRQPITVPEIQEVRGVNAVSVLKTLLDKKLITTSGRKNVVGRPILYRTTKEFLVHFGLKNLDELPSLEEFEDLARSAAGSVAETNFVSESPPTENQSRVLDEAAAVPYEVTFEEIGEPAKAPAFVEIPAMGAVTEEDHLAKNTSDSLTVEPSADSEDEPGKAE